MNFLTKNLDLRIFTKNNFGQNTDFPKTGIAIPRSNQSQTFWMVLYVNHTILTLHINVCCQKKA